MKNHSHMQVDSQRSAKSQHKESTPVQKTHQKMIQNIQRSKGSGRSPGVNMMLKLFFSLLLFSYLAFG